MEAASSSKTLITTYKAKQCLNPEVHNLNAMYIDTVHMSATIQTQIFQIAKIPEYGYDNIHECVHMCVCKIDLLQSYRCWVYLTGTPAALAVYLCLNLYVRDWKGIMLLISLDFKLNTLTSYLRK
jgi:hypothetical protein